MIKIIDNKTQAFSCSIKYTRDKWKTKWQHSKGDTKRNADINKANYEKKKKTQTRSNRNKSRKKKDLSMPDYHSVLV